MKSNIIILLTIYITLTQCGVKKKIRNVSKRQQEELEKQHRNAICCEKNMRCCQKPKPPPIEIRAVLARCPNLGARKTSGTLTRTLTKPMLSVSEGSLKSFQGFDEDEPLMQSKVVNCKRKLLITLKMHHKGTINCKHQYVVVDHVYDPITEKSVRLLNPYVIRLRQEQVSKSYHLKFLDYVNSEALEQIYNKHDSNYTGCYTSRLHSTCGIVKYEGKVIPYSEGFCCSCDSKKNDERQPDSVNEKNEAIISYSDPAYLLDRVQCPRNFFKNFGEENVADGKNNTTPKRSNSTQSTPTTEVQPSQPRHGVTESTDQPPKEVHGYKRDEIIIANTTKLPQNVSSSRWQYTTYSGKMAELQSPSAHNYLLSKSGTVPKNKRQGDLEDENIRESDEYFRHIQLADRKKYPKSYMDTVKKSHMSSNLQDYIDHLSDKLGDNVFTQRLVRKLRQISPSGVQIRGNQNCANRFTPPGLDPERYHESTHCLRFSDVWYGIYKLGEPFVEQNVAINIFERFESETSSEKWREITNGTILMGSRSPLYEDEVPTISIAFSAKTFPTTDQYTALHRKRILIPEGVRDCDMHKYAEMRNGPEEYLVVNPVQVAIEGDQCDKIGVGFEAFFKQPTRCGVPKGTCLHNQPKHLWRHDKTKEKNNQLGCYFLKYHANTTKEPIFTNATTGEKYLHAEYIGAHITNIDIEIKADFNAVIRLQTTAVITEVYVDSTCDKVTIVTIKVTNSGLISSKYMVQLSDFPLDLPESFGRIKSKLSLIAPQNQHIFTLEIRGKMPTDLVYCSVEVLNFNKELVALRRVRIQKYDRCICTWHCLCACVASSEGLKCHPMSLEHYHAAGFQGALPMITYMVHFTMLDDLISVVFYFSLFILAVLLILGISKACLGLCCYAVGIWGLNVILDLPKQIRRYYEKPLRNEPVIYDDEGYPIHPETKKRVRCISRATAFCTNTVFFFTYPIASCTLIVKRLCCSCCSKRKDTSTPKQYKNIKHKENKQADDHISFSVKHKPKSRRSRERTTPTKDVTAPDKEGNKSRFNERRKHVAPINTIDSMSESSIMPRSKSETSMDARLEVVKPKKGGKMSCEAEKSDWPVFTSVRRSSKRSKRTKSKQDQSTEIREDLTPSTTTSKKDDKTKRKFCFGSKKKGEFDPPTTTETQSSISTSTKAPTSSGKSSKKTKSAKSSNVSSKSAKSSGGYTPFTTTETDATSTDVTPKKIFTTFGVPFKTTQPEQKPDENSKAVSRISIFSTRPKSM